MIEIRFEIGVKEFAASGPGASTLRFDGHKNRIDFRQNTRVFELEHPAVLFLIVYIEDPQAFSRTLGWTACTPNLKDAFRFAVL